MMYQSLNERQIWKLVQKILKIKSKKELLNFFLFMILALLIFNCRKKILARSNQLYCDMKDNFITLL